MEFGLVKLHWELNHVIRDAYINSSSLTVMGLFMSTPPFLKLKWNKLNLQERFDFLHRQSREV